MLLSLALALPLDPAAHAPLQVGVLVCEDRVEVDTDALTWCEDGLPCLTGVLVGDVAVFAFDSLDIQEDVDVRGTRPAAILAQGDLVVGGKIDVDAGVGAPVGGGMAGTGRSGGGNGAPGESAGGGAGGAAVGDPFTRLEGGGDGGGPRGGRGGGALQLSALGALVIEDEVEANGDGGGDSDGGGAGGSLLLVGGQGSRCANGRSTFDVRGGNGGSVCLSYTPTYPPSCTSWQSGGDGGDGVIVAFGLDLASCEVEGAPRVDLDLDGDGLPGIADCDDADAARGGPEIPCDGVDQDCDPLTVDDADGDGDGWFLCDGDCDDVDPDANPGEVDRPGDGVDQDCDGSDAVPEETGAAGETGRGDDSGQGDDSGVGGDGDADTDSDADGDSDADVDSDADADGDSDGGVTPVDAEPAVAGALACGCRSGAGPAWFGGVLWVWAGVRRRSRAGRLG